MNVRRASTEYVEAGNLLDRDQVVTAKDQGKFGTDARLGEILGGEVRNVERRDPESRERGAAKISRLGKSFGCGSAETADRGLDRGRSRRGGRLARSKKNKAERGRGQPRSFFMGRTGRRSYDYEIAE
jgi:hypothetical protein